MSEKKPKWLETATEAVLYFYLATNNILQLNKHIILAVLIRNRAATCMWPLVG